MNKYFIFVCCLFFLNGLGDCTAKSSFYSSRGVWELNDSDYYRKEVLKKALSAAYQKWLNAAQSQQKNILHYAIDLFEQISKDLDFDFLLESIKYILSQNDTLLDKKIDHKPPVFYALEKYAKKPFVDRLVKFFLKIKANPNSCDKAGWTLLHYAVQSWNLNLAKILIDEYKADVNAVTLEKHITPLHIACALGDVEAFDLLMNNQARADVCTVAKANALHFAAGRALLMQNDSFIFASDSFGIFFQQKDKASYEKQLHFRNHMVERLMIEGGLSCNQSDSFGFAAFDYAEKFGNDLLWQTMLRLDKILRCSKQEVDQNNKKNSQIFKINTPNRYAPDSEFENWIACAQVEGIPVLQYIFSLLENNLTLMQFNLVCDGLEYVLYFYPELSTQLIENKEPIFYVVDKYINKFWVRSVVEILLEHGANQNSCDDNGWSILHCAVKAGNYELFKSITKYHADISVFTYKEKISLLHLACFYGNKEVFDFLLEHKVDVNFADANGVTTLHFAVGCGYFKPNGEYKQILMPAHKVNKENKEFYEEQIAIRKYMITKLIYEQEVSCFVEDKNGLDARDYALAFGHDELCACLPKSSD